jgi:hypothetical protein
MEDDFPIGDFNGLSLHEMQVYLDVNLPGHRIYSINIMGSDRIKFKIVGPIYNLTISEKKHASK